MFNKITILSCFILSVLLFACHTESQRDKDYNKIKAMIANDSLKSSENRGLYMDSIIRECEKFVTLYPKDSMADFVLLQTQIYQATQKRFRLSLVQIDKLMRIYPNSKYVPYAMFYKGEILNTELNQKEEARKIWNDLIAKYPKNTWAEQAQSSLQFLEDSSIEQQFKRIVKDKGNN